ncbi:MAG: alcohol dehydrogenase catalytic domain-containing protein, partial [Actinobacteria bacterium]|nr:alcohol dehydrogenase catalytic domain-containing protein [Actinomycetota bacterium]
MPRRARSVGTMRALRVSLAPHRVGLALAAGRLRPDLYRGAPGSPLRLVEVPRPALPDGWVRIRPTLAGICASDRKMLHITGFGTTLLGLFGAPPRIIPGHEIVGVVTHAPPESGVAEGDRVVAEPTLSCHDKALAPCARCTAGDDGTCEHLPLPGSLTPGQGFGHNARYGGGWADELVAPAHRVLRVPDDLEDRCAVLAEPLAIAVHAVARVLPRPGERVLVIGPGAIGLSLCHALHALAPRAEVTVAGVHSFSDPFARSAGAHHLISGTRAVLVTAAAAVLGSRIHGSRISGPLLAAGFDTVYDAVGSPQTIDDALRMTRPGGTVVMVATSFRQKVDWSLLWARELHLRGTVYYGDEDVPASARLAPGRRRAMQVALEILEDARPRDLVTHQFPL